VTLKLPRHDLPAEERLHELRAGLLTHRVVERRIRHLTRMRLAARESSAAHRRYIGACLATALALDHHLSAGDLDFFATIWWARKRARVWGMSFPVPPGSRYGREGMRARGGVDAGSVALGVEALARRLDGSHPVPDAEFMDPSRPRVIRRRLRKLAHGL